MQWLLVWTFALNENLRLHQIYHQQPTSTCSVFHQSNIQEFGAPILRIGAKWALNTTAFILCTNFKQAPQNILSLPVPVRQTAQIHFPDFLSRSRLKSVTKLFVCPVIKQTPFYLSLTFNNSSPRESAMIIGSSAYSGTR